MAERTLTDEEMLRAMDEPPQTTRAKLRGDFIKRAKERKRDYTVDWVHSQAERPGPAHRALQGPVQVRRRAGRQAHRQPLSGIGRRWTRRNAY